MKIERINDNQIRCTLSREDLLTRQLKISELAYGSDKAKDLFREMMEKAQYEFGFEIEDIPIMIEAIPLSTESVILVITKVDYPDELDTRFSRFSDAPDGIMDGFQSNDGTVAPESADGVLDLFRQMQKNHSRTAEPTKKETPFIPLKDAVADHTPDINIWKLYRFHNLNDAIRLAQVLAPVYRESNSLYRNTENGRYYLFLSKGSHTPEEFNRFCNILSEYAVQDKYSESVEAHLRESHETVVQDNAVQTLGQI